MSKLEAIGGSTAWALVAILMLSAALQPVDVSAATAAKETPVAALCADGSSGPAMGCESSHL